MTAAEVERVAEETGLELQFNHRTGNYRLEAKRQNAIAYLRSRGKYVLDPGTPTPPWGHGPKAA